MSPATPVIQHRSVNPVGDLNDRGPDSLGVIRWRKRAHWFYAVLGNQEAAALGADDEVGPPGMAARRWIHIGRRWASFLSRRDSAMLMGVLRTLSLAMEVLLRDGLRVGVVGAELANSVGWTGLEGYATKSLPELDADKALEWRQLRQELLWARQQTRLQDDLRDPERVRSRYCWRKRSSRISLLRRVRRTPGIDLLISGHAVQMTGYPGVFENRVCLDTGAYAIDGALTLLEPLTGRYHPVQWRKGLKGPLRKVTHHRLPQPPRAWDVRRQIMQPVGAPRRDPYDF